MRESTDFGKKIQKLRESYGEDQATFARRVGIDRAYISYYEKSPYANPPMETLQKITEACNVSLDWLCAKTKDTSTEKNTEEVTELKKALVLAIDDIKKLHIEIEMLKKDAGIGRGDMDSFKEKTDLITERKFASIRNEMEELKKDVSRKMISVKTDVNELTDIVLDTAISQEDVLKKLTSYANAMQLQQHSNMISIRPQDSMIAVKRSKSSAVYEYQAEKVGEFQMDVEEENVQTDAPKFRKNAEYNPTLREAKEKGLISTKILNCLLPLHIPNLQTLARLADSDLQKIRGIGTQTREDIKKMIYNVYKWKMPDFHVSWKDCLIDTRLVSNEVFKFLRANAIYTYRDLQEKILEMGPKLERESKNVRSWVGRFLEEQTKLDLAYEMERADGGER